ncbi:MAG: DegV family EDD domain-containing protein [Anaerolineae bacterium]|jgi:DegV family protein with EDD domain|nr:DegV family EDD domain-containing protein [Anaerolineae bacterium]
MIYLVTDSGAQFAQSYFVEQNRLLVLPNRIEMDGKLYREGIDITAEDVVRRMAKFGATPIVHAPTVDDYLDLLGRLSMTGKPIVVITSSREMMNSWANARLAKLQLGNENIHVVDSQTICAGQGMLVKVALRAIADGKPVQEVVRLVRGASERIFTLYYAESFQPKVHDQIMGASHALLGMILNVKPFFAIEHGRLSAVEKVRTRSQALERLVEFAIEFTDIEDILIAQYKVAITEQTRQLQDRLAAEFPKHKFPYALYGATLASKIGVDATGIVILEQEIVSQTREYDED